MKFRFEHTEYLYLLLLLIPFIVVFLTFMYWRRATWKKIGVFEHIVHLMPDRPTYVPAFRFLLFMLAFLFLVIGLANPQMGTTYEKVKREGIDLIIALDVSRSMLAEDLKPNRLERAKQFISQLIEKLQNDRIGMVVFAGNAYLQVPLTVDYSAAKLYLKTIKPEIVPTQGTAIADAIELALQAFEAGEKKHKALVIISDGENHEGDIQSAIDRAVEEGVAVYTIGVGSPAGAPIPVYRNNIQVDFHRDKEGNIVVTRLNEGMLQEIAAKGNGKYYRLTSGNEVLNNLLDDIARIEKKEFEARVFTDYEDFFQYFLIASLFFLFIDILFTDRRVRWLSEWDLFKTD